MEYWHIHQLVKNRMQLKISIIQNKRSPMHTGIHRLYTYDLRAYMSESLALDLFILDDLGEIPQHFINVDN